MIKERDSDTKIVYREKIEILLVQSLTFFILSKSVFKMQIAIIQSFFSVKPEI